jgi:putative transposase
VDLRTESLKRTITAWKAYAAKAGKVEWQTGFFDHRLRTKESFAEKAAYIRNNPVRAGLVKQPKDWPWILENR